MHMARLHSDYHCLTVVGFTEQSTNWKISCNLAVTKTNKISSMPSFLCQRLFKKCGLFFCFEASSCDEE